MSKNGRKASMETRVLVFCSVFAAMSIALARVLGIPIGADVRISLEAIPIILTGVLFGPLAGGMVGFVADFLGSIMTFGFNPILCVTPVLVGVFSGLLRRVLGKKVTIWKLLLIEVPIFALVYVLWQGYALTLVFGGEHGGFWANYIYRVGTRSVQFGVTVVVDCILVYLMFRANVFNRVGIWPLNKEQDRRSGGGALIGCGCVVELAYLAASIDNVTKGSKFFQALDFTNMADGIAVLMLYAVGVLGFVMIVVGLIRRKK